MRTLQVPLHSGRCENQLIKHSKSGDKHFASTNSHHFLELPRPHLYLLNIKSVLNRTARGFLSFCCTDAEPTRGERRSSDLGNAGHLTTAEENETWGLELYLTWKCQCSYTQDNDLSSAGPYTMLGKTSHSFLHADVLSHPFICVYACPSTWSALPALPAQPHLQSWLLLSGLS